MSRTTRIQPSPTLILRLRLRMRSVVTNSAISAIAIRKNPIRSISAPGDGDVRAGALLLAQALVLARVLVGAAVLVREQAVAVARRVDAVGELRVQGGGCLPRLAES